MGRFRILCKRKRAGSCQQLHRSEEHTSELQSQFHLVCRLLLEKKKKNNNQVYILHKNLILALSLTLFYSDTVSDQTLYDSHCDTHHIVFTHVVVSSCLLPNAAA